MAFSVTKPLGFFGLSLSLLTGAAIPSNLRPVHGPLPTPRHHRRQGAQAHAV